MYGHTNNKLKGVVNEDDYKNWHIYNYLLYKYYTIQYKINLS